MLFSILFFIVLHLSLHRWYLLLPNCIYFLLYAIHRGSRICGQFGILGHGYRWNSCLCFSRYISLIVTVLYNIRMKSGVYEWVCVCQTTHVCTHYSLTQLSMLPLPTIHMCVSIYIYVYMYFPSHTCMHAYILTYIYSHTHTKSLFSIAYHDGRVFVAWYIP